MVVVSIGERKINVYQSLLDSVTDAFKQTSNTIEVGSENVVRDFELPIEDMGTFQMFLLWLYSGDRRHQMEEYHAESWISLYVFGIYLKCESLKADALHCLLRIIRNDDDSANSFFRALNSMFVAEQAQSHNFSNFHTILDELSNAPSIDDYNMDILLELYVKSVKWNNRNWKNWVIDSIRDGLESSGDVLIFEQVKFVFDGTEDGDPLRRFCAALAYYQRCWLEGPIKTTQQLDVGGMRRRLRDIRGFMDAYLDFEDEHRQDFTGEPPKDPRDRHGEMPTWYFHIHRNGETCTPDMELDE